MGRSITVSVVIIYVSIIWCQYFIVNSFHWFQPVFLKHKEMSCLCLQPSLWPQFTLNSLYYSLQSSAWDLHTTSAQTCGFLRNLLLMTQLFTQRLRSCGMNWYYPKVQPAPSSASVGISWTQYRCVGHKAMATVLSSVGRFETVFYINTNSYKINTQVFPTFPFCSICKLVSSQVQEDNANLYWTLRKEST